MVLCLSENFISGIPGKPSRGNDVLRCMNQERPDSISNLLRRKTFWKQMERNEKRSIALPITEVKSDLPSNLPRVLCTDSLRNLFHHS